MFDGCWNFRRNEDNVFMKNRRHGRQRVHYFGKQSKGTLKGRPIIQFKKLDKIKNAT